MLPVLEGMPPLVVITGKGGVGKTLVSCAVARARALVGDCVLLLELDARESMHRFLDSEPSGGEIVPVGANLDAQSLRPKQVVDALIQKRVRPAWVARRVLASTIYEHFVEGAPGLREVAALGYAQKRASEYDLVVLDAPATGHGVALLEAPGLLARAVDSGPLAEMAVEVAAMIADPTQCRLWAVSTAESMAIRETIELDGSLRDSLGRGLDQVLLNRLLPKPEVRELPPVWLSDWSRRAQEQARQEAVLKAAWAQPLVRLPMAAGDGPEALAAVEAVLAGAD